MSDIASVVEVDPTEFKKEWHNYARLMIGIAATCLVAVGGNLITTGNWKARTEERLSREEKTSELHSKQIDTLTQNSAQINGRLGVIEERTQNTVDGIKRIEGKLDNAPR